MNLHILATIITVLSLSSIAFAQEKAFEQKIKKFKNSSRFVVRYDEAKDRTGVAVSSFKVSTPGESSLTGSGMHMSAGFEFKGQTLKHRPGWFYVRFVSTSSSWRFFENRDLYAAIDGVRISLGTTEHSGKAGSRVGGLMGGIGSGNSFVIEDLTYAVTPEVFSKLAHGKKVELEIGGYSVKLKREHQQAFRDLMILAEP
jgi:hypothetical protein